MTITVQNGKVKGTKQKTFVYTFDELLSSSRVALLLQADVNTLTRAAKKQGRQV